MRNPNCTDCDLHKGVKTVCLWGEGPLDADIMFIGRDPGGNEDVLGRPFVGKAGAMLNQLLEHGGIDRSKVYISNITKCRPPDNRQPTKEEKAACFQYIKAEINTVNPKVIVVLGGDALEAITGQDKIMKLAGTVINVDSESLSWKGKVYATVHPSYLLRNSGYVPRAEKHFKDIGYYFRNEEPQKLPTKYVYVTEFEQVDKLFARMHAQKLIAFDTETNSLDFTHGKILCFSFSWKENSAVVLPLVGYLEETLWTEEQLAHIHTELKKVFANENIDWIAHNMSFDHKYIMKYDMDIAGRMHDTMLLQHLLDENAKDMKGLKALAVAYTDLGRYDDPLDEVVLNLKAEKSKKLSNDKKELKKHIKLIQKVLDKDPEDAEALQDLEEVETNMGVLNGISIDVSYAEIPTDILWPYAAMDADATIRIFNHHMEELKKHSTYYSTHPSNSISGKEGRNLFRLYHKLVMPLRRVLDEMEYRGARMDIPYLHILDKKYTKRIAEITGKLTGIQEIKDTEVRLLLRAQEKAEEKYLTLKSVQVWDEFKKTGKYTTVRPPRAPKFPDKVAYGKHYGKVVEFNMNSPAHLRILLFGILRCASIKPTDSGEPSTDREVLEHYENKPGISLLLENRKLVKLHNTYVKGSLAQLTATNSDRVHTNFNQHITVTGRLSSSGPNLQNIPREDKDIKRAFIPKADDWCILQLDYSQAEFRMWAQLADDTDMFTDIEAGLDIHTQTASDFWGIPMDTVTKPQRTAAKFVVFGLMYGRGSKSVAKQVGISEGEADTIKDKFFSRYPRASRWLQNTKSSVKMDKFVPGFFGRVRRLPDATSPDNEKAAEAQRQSVNAPIQGSAADMTGIALIKIRRMLWETGLGEYAHLILTVHDSIILEVAKDKLGRVTTECKKCMTEKLAGIRTGLMDADAEYGKNWADIDVPEEVNGENTNDHIRPTNLRGDLKSASTITV